MWSLVEFDPDDDPTRNDVAWFLMGDFLRLSPWSRGLGLLAQAVKKNLACFVAHCESWAQDTKIVVLVIRVFLM